MINLKFWRKLSKISIYIVGVDAIIIFFFRQYLKDFRLVLLLIDVFAIITYLISKLMYLKLRKK